MPPIRPSTDVLPVTEFRANTSAMIEQMHSTGRPLILTQHGRSAAVLLDPSVYESLIDEIELLRDLSVSEAQIAAGQVVSHDEVARRMREKYSL
ncbi:MAG: type II toxin-antitoxin system Phd/YefM family antitoxin [Actinobacteria bacterium]|nr:type II toxin-antitoxin system Phd/YefM family antitoxin [Actinomycetota bacterium]